MVVVAWAAQPVAALARSMRELVDDLPLPEIGERAVDGRETDPPPALTQAAVELLRCRVVRFCGERIENEQPLPCRPQADA